MFGNKNIVVIWVTGRQLVVLGGKITEPQVIAFPENVISNLEIVDQDALYALIKSWTSQHPAAGAMVVWIFGADVYYEHVMAENEKVEWESVVVRFLDLLPFEEVESRVYTSLAGTKVVAINKDFYNSLKRGFALQGYVTKAEIVASELGKLSAAQTLDKNVYAYVLKNLDLIDRNRLVGEDMEVSGGVPQPEEPKKKSSSMPILIVVFVILLGVMGFMLLRMNK